VIVTDAPTAPEVGDTLLMLGNTVNATPLLFTPLAFTTTFPVVAPLGTVTLIDVALQLVTVAVVPLNFTVLEPWLEPKFVPVTVTAAPTAPEVGDTLVMLGAATTVKLTPLLATPPTVTTTLPVVAPVGTVATIDVVLQLPIDVAVVPLNFTVLEPWVEPKFVPVMVTDAPTAPEVGDRLVIVGAAANKLAGNNRHNDMERMIRHLIPVTIHLVVVSCGAWFLSGSLPMSWEVELDVRISQPALRDAIHSGFIVQTFLSGEAGFHFRLGATRRANIVQLTTGFYGAIPRMHGSRP
jgi:hypothetical protein